MSEPKILDPSGAVAQSGRWQNFNPPAGANPFFGWIDPMGEPNTVRVDAIVTVAKDARTGRWIIVLSSAGVAPSIDEPNAYRLLERLGWKTATPRMEKPRFDPTRRVVESAKAAQAWME